MSAIGGQKVGDRVYAQVSEEIRLALGCKINK